MEIYRFFKRFAITGIFLLLVLQLTLLRAEASVSVKEGTYTVVSSVGGRVLDVTGARLTNGTNIRIWAPNGTKAQQFKVR